MNDAALALDLLRDFTHAHGAPGHEGAVRALFRERLSPFPLTCDALGGIAALRAGPPDAPLVALASHLDEVGFLVQNITADGFLQFVPLGGWWSHTLPAQRVRVLTRSAGEVPGVIAAVPPHFLAEDARQKVLPIDKLSIDVGARDRRQAREEFGIEIGDPVVPDADLTPLRNPDLLMAKAFDNRVGVALVVQAMLALRETALPCALLGLGTAQEEVGTRGARVAGARFRPRVALVLEGPPADDTPGLPAGESQGKLGGGVQIRVMDPSAIMNRRLVDLAVETARAEQIPHQLTVRRSGGTDAAAFQFAGEGVPVVVLGVPARYIHTHNSIISLPDYLAALRLVTALVRRLDGATVDGLTDFLSVP
jgi:endoglucanase